MEHMDTIYHNILDYVITSGRIDGHDDIEYLENWHKEDILEQLEAEVELVACQDYELNESQINAAIDYAITHYRIIRKSY